jgi:hypothetical protein
MGLAKETTLPPCAAITLVTARSSYSGPEREVRDKEEVQPSQGVYQSMGGKNGGDGSSGWNRRDPNLPRHCATVGVFDHTFLPSERARSGDACSHGTCSGKPGYGGTRKARQGGWWNGAAVTRCPGSKKKASAIVLGPVIRNQRL